MLESAAKHISALLSDRRRLLYIALESVEVLDFHMPAHTLFARLQINFVVKTIISAHQSNDVADTFHEHVHKFYYFVFHDYDVFQQILQLHIRTHEHTRSEPSTIRRWMWWRKSCEKKNNFMHEICRVFKAKHFNRKWRFYYFVSAYDNIRI